MHLKAQIDFTSHHDVLYSANLTMVSKRCLIVNYPIRDFLFDRYSGTFNKWPVCRQQLVKFYQYIAGQRTFKVVTYFDTSNYKLFKCICVSYFRLCAYKLGIFYALLLQHIAMVGLFPFVSFSLKCSSNKHFRQLTITVLPLSFIGFKETSQCETQTRCISNPATHNKVVFKRRLLPKFTALHIQCGSNI